MTLLLFRDMCHITTDSCHQYYLWGEMSLLTLLTYECTDKSWKESNVGVSVTPEMDLGVHSDP